MTERMEERRILFPDFPAPLNGKFHSITIRESIMRIALEAILTNPKVDAEIARDIAREVLHEAFPLKVRQELEHDRSEVNRFQSERERGDWPTCEENPEEYIRLHEMETEHLQAIGHGLWKAFQRARKWKGVE